ncbi:unnamed protein product [Rotaria socialis]|uniref:Bridge-like lipid transfer protein family member 1 C-terminal domain-containing protein n=15 Tax=Rotaria socialis TaxID=392032 RepID=A0A820VGJ6_9BILA|nr:unnamed protein product [Rotaria socialis]CAF4501346.1 unnamed protein product [Rotaria socialis]
MQAVFRTEFPLEINTSFNFTSSNEIPSSLTTPSTLEVISNEIIDYFETHREQIPLLIIVYLLTIFWIIYLILYHSRIQGIALSYLLRRFYFKDAAQFKFDSFSISFISGSIMFRNLHYTTGSYYVYIKDGCLTFRYWSRTTKKSAIRLKILLYCVDIQLFSPIRSNTFSDTNNSNEDLRKGSTSGISTKVDESSNVNTINNNEERFFVQSLRSLFPAIEIKVDYGRISIGHDTVPYGLLISFNTMNSTFSSESPSKYVPHIDLMTLIYSITYKNLRIQFYPIKAFTGERHDIFPPTQPSKTVGDGVFQVFECSEGEFEYIQDVPGKMIEPSADGESIPDVLWEIRMKCNKETKVAYGPWADRQRELLWQYFLPTLYEESPITNEPTAGQTRIFKSVHFKLLLNCSTKLDLYFMNKTKLQQLHIECPAKGSYVDAVFPFSTQPDGFDTFLSVNLLKTIMQTNLSFSPLVEADNVHIKLHIHYPRLWNSLQLWFIDIAAKKAQIYFVFEHKNFFQALINDWSSSLPPDIYSFAPFIYNITLRGDHIELLVPCNQGNWLDCSNVKTAENNYLSLCAKTLVLTYPLAFFEFCPKNTSMDLTVEVSDVLARLVLPRNNRMYYVIEGIDMHKQFYTPNGIKSHLSLLDVFDTRDNCFECGEVAHIKILVQILLHSSPPIDLNRTDLQYVQHVKSIGNRQTFHPNKLEYDIFNIELDMGPVNLLLHGLFLKNLWWVKDNLFGWNQVYHDIHESELIRQNKIIVNDDPLLDMIDENQPFDPRYFRPLMVTLRVALHNITGHLLHHTDLEPCPIGFCERLCVEMTTNLDETKLQVLFLPVNIYVEDTIVRNKADQQLSTGSLQLSGLIIRGHAMLSHEGLPPERETLEYAWQMDILLGKASARLTTIQVEKLLCFLKNFYLQMMEDEYTLVRSPIMDKTKWVEKLKYDVLRFSLDSVDLSLIEVGNALHAQVAPVRLCMCNMHTSSCNEGLTLKVGTILIRQLLRLYPGSWLEAGSIHVPELRMNGKFDCHPPTSVNLNQQIEFLLRHDQQMHRLHFLYNTKSQQVATTTSRRPSNLGLQASVTLSSCACLGGSANYYTLVQGEHFFKSTFRLSEQPSFGRSLFRPDLHVIHSHHVFQQKYHWDTYQRSSVPDEQLNDEEIFYPFDFCTQQQNLNEDEIDSLDGNDPKSNTTRIFSGVARSNSFTHKKHKNSFEKKSHKRSSSSIPLFNNATSGSRSSSSVTTNDSYLTPKENASLNNSREKSLNHITESSSSSSKPLHFNLLSKSVDEQIVSLTSSNSSSSSSSNDSLAALEEILQTPKPENSSTLLPQKSVSSNTEYNSIPQPSLFTPSWISLRSQMKMPIQKSTLLSTTYIRYLSHYRSSTWSNVPSFPPLIQQDQINHHPLLDFNCVSQGFSCSFLSESLSSSPSRQHYPSYYTRTRASIGATFTSSNIIATENELCLRFKGPLNILLTPLMLECLTAYIEKWKTYELHPMSILDDLHFQAQTTANIPSTSIDLSATKLSVQLSKINICLLQAGLAEDHVQLTELRRPVDIVTMSLFALSCKDIQMETILSKRDQSTAGVFKISSITGQFRRFENDFSSIENVNIHAIQSQRCRLQFHMPNDIRTHLPIGDNRRNVGFVMNEFGLQRLCFKLINNAAKQQQEERQQTVSVITEVNEIQTAKPSTKHKSKRKQTEPLLPSPTTNTPPNTISPPKNSLSSSIFDGSIDHVWISFPEPPRHTQSTSNSLKRVHSNPSSNTQQLSAQKKLSSYTRYDWNFLSTLSPTVLGWFCVINRVKKPVKKFLKKREKRIDTVLAYFLIEIATLSTLQQSKLYELFTPKTRFFISYPVCQMITEFRKHFNRNAQINIDLLSNIIPEIEILKQGIREACRGWAQAFKHKSSPTSLSTLGHDATVENSGVRKRTAVQKTRSNASNRDTIIETNKRTTTTSFIGDALRRLEPTANINNTAGYRRLSVGMNESDLVQNTNSSRLNNPPAYYTDASSVEELFKILLEYAGVRLSVTSSIEPLFEKLGQTVLATVQIKKFDVKILPNELINDAQLAILNPSVELTILNVTNLNIQSVCKQSREHNQLHSANVQAGIRVQSVKQEVNLSLLRLVYQFYTVVSNAFEYIDMDELVKTDANNFQVVNDSLESRSRTTTITDNQENYIDKSNKKSSPINNNNNNNNNDLIGAERQCWKRLRKLVATYETSIDIKNLSSTTKNQRNDSQMSSDDSLEEHGKESFRLLPKQNDIKHETLLLSAFGWLIIDDIYYAASLGGLKVDGCMRKVQGSISLSQRLRNLQANTNIHNAKKYDGSLIVQIASTSLSLKETLSTSSDSSSHINTSTSYQATTTNPTLPTQEISVLDIIIGKSQALTSLQTRGINNLRLSGVTNIGTIAMDVPLRPQEVHDLVNRAGRLITSYVQEFLPDDTEQPSSATSNLNNDESDQTNTNIDDTITEINVPSISVPISTKRHLNIHQEPKLSSNVTTNLLETQTSLLSISKRPIFEVHITAHCKGMTFSTTLLSTLKAQYKIGVVEGVANLGITTSRFTAIVHEHALHFLNNNNTNNPYQLPTVSSDNHVRIDFPQIRCYGNYIAGQEQDNKPKGRLNLRTKIDLLKLTITADFLAQLVFVSKVIIHEINEILEKVSGVDHFQFKPTEVVPKTKRSKSADDIIDNDINEDDDEEEKIPTTPFIYTINISMKGFEVMGKTPSNTIVKFENGDKKLPILIKLTNYDEQNSLLLYEKSLIKAALNIKISLGQLLPTGNFQDAAYFKTKLLLKNSFQFDEIEKKAYFIRLTKPSFYWQSGAIDKGILFWLNYKNTYDYWNEQRGAFTTPTSDSRSIRSLVNVQPSPTTTNELNLMFQLHIIDLGVAIPLQQIDQPTKLSSASKTTTDYQSNATLNQRHAYMTFDESTDFLVFTLDQTTISACSCGAIMSSGSFEGFCFRFAENFQQTNPDWKPIRSSNSQSNTILNACCVPSGHYSMHSRAKHIENFKRPKWFLNVQWNMKGIDINIDSIISKRFSQLIRTITSTQLIEVTDNLNNDDDLSKSSDSSHLQNGNAINTGDKKDPSEDDERRKRLEYEYSILGQKIEALKRAQAPLEILKPEEARYRWLEKELLHTVKTEIQQKMKKQSNKTSLNRDRNRTLLSTLSVPNHKQTSSADYLNPLKNVKSEMIPHELQTPSSTIYEEAHESTASFTPTMAARTSSNEPDEAQSNSSPSLSSPSEITSTPAVDFELNLQIEISSGSCNLYTRRDLIAHSPLTNNLTKQQKQATLGLIQIINKIEYQVSQFSLPGFDVDANYNTKHANVTNKSLNKRASFYCRAMIQSPATQIIIHPILLDFLEQTLEYVKLPREQQRRSNIRDEHAQDQNSDNDHLDNIFLIEDQTSSTSIPIDVVVSIFIQPCVLLFTCLPTHPMECELRLPAVDVVFSSNRTLSDKISSSNNENLNGQIFENSLFGLNFSIYMKDFKLNVYHPFSGESKVHLFEDIRSGQLQTRNALAMSVQSVSINISRTRYVLINEKNEYLNSIQLSIVAQISRAQFEYDIRRFSEILTFPKIWYNRSLARRLFFGDENLPTGIPPTNRITQTLAPTAQIASTINKILPKQARIILAIQLKELHISMRMSNVMGKVEWNTKDVYSTGSLTLTSEGKRTFFLSLGLQNSTFQAEQGIIGGIIRLKNLRTTGLISQDFRDRSLLVDASHLMNILTDAIEIRIDYMGSPTLMGRICHILLQLNDDRNTETESNAMPSSTLVLLNLRWSQLHLMITRSTTPDILKMAMKLTEFVNAQIANSKNLLSSIQYDFSSDQKNIHIKKSSNVPAKYDISVIKKHVGMNGGEIMLQGHNLTIVIFHGLNFKSRQWALFSLNEPQINFVTDRGAEGDINQKLFFYLDHQSQTTFSSSKSRSNIASISRVTRNSNEPPAHLTINEWFNYASSTISAVGLRDFPTMDEPETPASASSFRSRQYELNAESIFILPALELRFQTRQLNGQVHCSFETEFYEHIMFTFNAEHFYFLHDLISSYIKEKERTASVTVNNDKTRQRLTTTSSTSSDNQIPPPLDELRSDDIRRFICPDSKWKLQPTIKLLTAYGNEVEPFGADYILQKLGFRHARLTIPKWVQRGIMDPCEQSMTIVQLILIFLLPERFKELCMKQ